MANNKNGNAAPQTASVDIVAKSAILKQFKQEYDALHPDGKPIDLTKERIVGRNGYFIGQQFHLTGELVVAPVNDADGKKTGVFLALKTKEGVDLSLAALMGVTSLRGYTLEGKLKEERKGANPEDLNEFTAEVSDKVKAQAAKNNEFKGWVIPTRDLYKMAAMIEADASIVADKTVTFEGIALRPVRRRQDNTDFNGIDWQAGDVSIITQRLWSVA
jgi:hypothetical protein